MDFNYNQETENNTLDKQEKPNNLKNISSSTSNSGRNKKLIVIFIIIGIIVAGIAIFLIVQ